MIPVFNFKQFNPYIAVFLGSVLFSLIASICEPYLNNDGIFYIDAANVYLAEGFAKSLEAYPWPFYSILIAMFHQMTGVPILMSARLLNILILSFTCIVFVKLYAEITKNKGNLWVASILILTLTGINKYRDDVMRDFGYWCFVMTGLLSFFYYFQRPKIRHAIIWQISMLIAFLFRIEALALIILGPFAIFFKRINRKKLIEFCNLYSIYLLVLVFMGILIIYNNLDVVDISSTRLRDILKFGSLKGLIGQLSIAIHRVGDIFWYDGLNIEKNFGTLLTVLIVAMLTYCLINIVTCLSFPFAILTVYGFFKKKLDFQDQNRIVLYFILIQFFVLMFFLSQKFLLVPRYTTILVFLLLFFTGQIAEKFIDKINRQKKWKTISIIFMILIFGQTADTLITFGGYSKKHIVNAGLWAKDHIESHQPLFSSDLKAVYYAERHFLLNSEIPTDIIFKMIDSRQFSRGTHIIVDGKDEENQTDLDLLNDYEEAGEIRIVKKITNKENDWAVIARVEKGQNE